MAWRCRFLAARRSQPPSPRNDFVKNYRVHPTHWLVSTQVPNGVASRFESDALVQPSVDQGRSEFSGVANLYYPDWMAGTWDVEQTLTRAEAPLGLKFIGGPRGDLAIAQKSLDEQRSRIGQPQQPV